MPKKRDYDDMKMARGRLKGALMQGLASPSDEDDDDDEDYEEEEYDDDEDNNIPRRGRPSKRKLEMVQYAEQQTYIMKLFDRSIDLARFNCNSPLYPICRAWIINQIKYLQGKRKKRVGPNPRTSNPIQMELSGDEMDELYELPAPVGPPISRIPDPPDVKKCADIAKMINSSHSTREQTLQVFKPKWKKIRKSWLEQSQKCEARYDKSDTIFKALHKMN